MTENQQPERVDLRVRTKQFALRVIRLFSALPKRIEAEVIGRQVLRSGTSVGANFREAHRARSDAEFLDSGRGREGVGGASWELLPEVRRRWRQVRAVEANLEALFPTPPSEPAGDTPAPPRQDPSLPHIPGYEMQALLGRGGMGVVYQARHLRLNRTVALKLLLAGRHPDPQDLARFQREAEAGAGLRHTNIVQVYDVGGHEGRPVLTIA